MLFSFSVNHSIYKTYTCFQASAFSSDEVIPGVQMETKLWKSHIFTQKHILIHQIIYEYKSTAIL